MGVRVFVMVSFASSVISVSTEITELFDFGQAFISCFRGIFAGTESAFMFVAAPNQGVFLFIVELLYTTFDLFSRFLAEITRGNRGSYWLA